MAALALLAILVIGWVDYLTGPDLSFALFYLLPIVTCARWTDGRITSASGVLASVSWFGADYALRSPAHLHVSLWNAITRLVIFVTLGTILNRLHRQRQELTALTSRLRDNLEREAQLARTDPVTGLANSRAFIEALERRVEQARGLAETLSVAYLDLDNFKQINDAYGHGAGDEVLRRMGRLLAEQVRAEDLAARVGGDEFALVCTGTPPPALQAIAGRLLERVADLAREFPGAALGVSIGVAHFDPAPADAETALRLADQSMYEAKANGKGTVVLRQMASSPA